MAINVATQLACAARSNQPGDGAAPLPPTDCGMSVWIVAPSGPLMVTASPSFRIAVAVLSVYRASSGCWLT